MSPPWSQLPPAILYTLVLVAVAGRGWRVPCWPVPGGTREVLMEQPGFLAGEHVLHRGGWVERPVRLYRDEWGIPHVRAQSVHDVFVGQGFAHAMDRLWQMDASRKQMEGRWAEWVGAAGLPADRLARRVRAGAASIRDYQALGADARAMVDAYAAGVNAYLRSHPAPAEGRASNFPDCGSFRIIAGKDGNYGGEIPEVLTRVPGRSSPDGSRNLSCYSGCRAGAGDQ